MKEEDLSKILARIEEHIEMYRENKERAKTGTARFGLTARIVALEALKMSLHEEAL